jgi:hypothetical protein
MNVIHDLSCGHDLQLYVGYARERPLLDSYPLHYTNAIVPYASACNGFLEVKVVNPLQAQTATTTVNIGVFARSKGMEFYGPRDNFPFHDGAGNPVDVDLSSQVVLQCGRCPLDDDESSVSSTDSSDFMEYQGALGDEAGACVPVEHILVPSPGDFPADRLYFGEKFESVRALMQKPCFYYTNAALTMSNPSNFPILLGVDPNRRWTWYTHYSLLTVGLAASERWKVLAHLPTDWIAISKCYSFVNNSNPGVMAPVCCPGDGKGVEVNVPYSCPRKYIPTNGYGRSGGGTVIAVGPASPGVNTSALMYHCLGPDIRATGFRQVPTVAYRATPPATMYNFATI